MNAHRSAINRFVTVAVALLAIVLGIAALVTSRLVVEQRPPDDARLVQAAIDSVYPGIYGDLGALRQDYPGFDPRVRRWSDDLLFLVGEGLYAVRMPEEEVIMTRDGAFRTTRTCGSVESHCEHVAPRIPLMGVVGTVQLGDPDFAIARNLQVHWRGTAGEVRVVGHCFWAFKASSEPLVLEIAVPGHNSMTLEGFNGHRLVAIQLSTQGSYYGTARLSRTAFEQSRDCSEQARAGWPNVGGAAWKR